MSSIFHHNVDALSPFVNLSFFPWMRELGKENKLDNSKHQFVV